jgi:hypothetical protein
VAKRSDGGVVGARVPSAFIVTVESRGKKAARAAASSSVERALRERAVGANRIKG